MLTQTITLEIDYDESSYDPPTDWTWHLLLDLPDPGQVRVVDYSKPKRSLLDGLADHIEERDRRYNLTTRNSVLFDVAYIRGIGS